MTLIQPSRKSPVGADLRHLLDGTTVLDDGPSLTAYAVDASIYRLQPAAIVLAETEEDIHRTVEYTGRHGIPLTPRAGGTNLTGSAVGTGIILDISRMNRILEVHPEEKWARVQPGIVYAELNKQLLRHGLHFGPDPSSGDMCKLGGMLANNSSGPHTLYYGSVKDNVRHIRICLASGEWVEAKTYDRHSSECRALLDRYPSLQTVCQLAETHAALIRERRPMVSKNSCGYNLFDFVEGLDRQLLDLPKLFIGSEGTLGVMSEATIDVAPRPVRILTAMIHFQYLDEVGEAVPHLLGLDPSALEVMDANTLNLIGRHRYSIPDDSAATLLAEFYQYTAGEPFQALEEQLYRLCRNFRMAGPLVTATDPDRRDQLWKARKALYPTLYRFDGRKKPVNYIDDVVVKADRIGELIRYLEQYFGEQAVPVSVFGHIGNGNAHVLPLLDVNDAEDFSRMVRSYREVHEAVLTRFNGSICGEHGDGRIRAELVRRMFGEDLYQVFVQVKRTFDPQHVMNPGVKISDRSFTESIDYERLGKPCATCAKCNSVCPVYDVFQSEDMSARGWFEIVTDKDYRYLDSKRVIDACLNCKSCRTICPAGVDVSDLILQRRAEHPNPVTALFFSLLAKTSIFNALVTLLAWTQRLWDRPAGRKMIDRLTRPVLRHVAETARIPPDMILPRLARRSLRKRYPELVIGNDQPPQRSTAYFHGCAANYFDDGVGNSVIAILQRLGLEPDLPAQWCSGTPIHTYGHLDLAKESARKNIKSFSSYQTIVTGCASCTLMLKDYPSLFSGEPEYEDAREIANRVRHVTELLAEAPSGLFSGSPVPVNKQSVTYHSSCHLRAAGVTRAPRMVLDRLKDYRVVEMQDAERCAGGAGTYMVKDYDTSQRILERKRLAIAQTGAHIVATSCPACMIQLKNGLRGQVDVRHVAELARMSLDREEENDVESSPR